MITTSIPQLHLYMQLNCTYTWLCDFGTTNRTGLEKAMCTVKVQEVKFSGQLCTENKRDIYNEELDNQTTTTIISQALKLCAYFVILAVGRIFF